MAEAQCRACGARVIYSAADYIDVLDYMLERTQALLLLIPEDDSDARETTLYQISVMQELKCQLEAGTSSRVVPVH